MKIKVNNFNLKDTVTCGQIFRYDIEEDNSYTIILEDRVINIKQDGNNLLVKSNNYDNLEEIVRKYFDLDFDYESINKELISIDKDLKKIIDSCANLKMINEPKFETIISYIISSNNRVSQIKKALDNISEKYGKKIIFENKEYYLFPSLDELKTCDISSLRECKVGFRDKYIYDFVKKIVNNEFDINKITNMNSIDALNYLKTLNGVGDKVASCILLFAYRRFDVFPIDTWVKKYMKDEYNIEGVKNIEKYIYEKYNKYSGLVIQYMFHYKRNKEK